MSKIIASASALLIASLAGCAANVSDDRVEATSASSELGDQSALTPRCPSVPAPVAALQFSAAGKADETYSSDPTTNFVEGTAEKIFVWVYMGNVTPGIHVVWASVTNPSGALMATLPIAFSTRAADVGTSVSPALWDASLTVVKARSSEIETGTGTITGFEVHTDFAISKLKVKKEGISEGTYTVTVAFDDEAMPPSEVSPAGSGTFSVWAAP